MKDLPAVLPEWRTRTVVELCVSMREAQDFSAMPILADALQDAGCPEGNELLAELRDVVPQYARKSALVACVLGDETREAVEWLISFADSHDCPGYETLVAAATGNHAENTDPEEPGYHYTANDGQYLHFGGSDAKGEIPELFWYKVEEATGLKIPRGERAERFSCSC